MPVKIFQPQVHVWWQSRSSNFFSSPAYYICTWTIVSLCSGMAERWGQQNSRVWKMWQGYYLHVLSCSSLNKIFWSYYQYSCLKNGEIWQKVCSNKITVMFVTPGLPSSFLSHCVVLVHRHLSDWLQRTCNLGLTNLYSWRDFSTASNLVSHNFALAIASLRTDSFLAFFPSFFPFFLYYGQGKQFKHYTSIKTHSA